MILAESGSTRGRAPRRVSPAVVAGGVLGAALFLAAGCGTAQSPVNPPAASAPSSSTAAASTASSTPAASATPATSTAASASGTQSSGSSIPKTGLNPALPVAGGALALLGAAVVVGGWRRLRGASR